MLQHKAFSIFLVCALLLNILWEFSHCSLYITCIEDPHKFRLLGFMALKDAVILTFLFLIFLKKTITAKMYAWMFLSGLVVAAILEYGSLMLHRWEYTGSMPIVLGVGISPLLQLAFTGVLALAITQKTLKR